MSQGRDIADRFYKAAQTITPPAFVSITAAEVEPLIEYLEGCYALPGDDFRERFREAIANGSAKIYDISLRVET